MADEYVIESVADDLVNPASPCWMIRMRKPDGTIHAHLMPKITLEWRAAEYGIDDIDELIDIALHEPFQVPADPVEARIQGVSRHEAPTLFEADSTAAARAGHRARIARTKAERVRVRNPQGDPLAAIRSQHGITPDGVRAKREVVDTYRWIILYGGLPVAIEEAPHA